MRVVECRSPPAWLLCVDHATHEDPHPSHSPPPANVYPGEALPWTCDTWHLHTLQSSFISELTACKAAVGSSTKGA